MSENGGYGIGESVPPRHFTPHYHGDAVRIIFVIIAFVLIVAQSVGANLPLSTFGSVVTAIVLVISAGITNPKTSRIHWFNEFIALVGTLLFGTTAVQHYRAGLSFLDPAFFFSETLALLSLLALYYTTRTVRGIAKRANIS